METGGKAGCIETAAEKRSGFLFEVIVTYLDQNERIEVERQFSLAKRKCNLGKVKTKLEETVGFTLAMSIVVLNLRKIQRTLSRLLLQILRYLWPQQKPAFIQ